VYQPLGAVLFLTAAIAENKRIPFDLPEAESELVAGYFTEYSAMKMGLFMLSEYVQIAVTAALFATLFLGGFNLPYMTDAGFAFPWGTEVALGQWVRVPLQLATFLAKVALLCVVQIQIRWSLPRFRYDQMLGLSWKLLLPVSLANLAVTVLVAWWQGGAR
jgi:NADH-quinone oxidoreductase subunit H